MLLASLVFAVAAARVGRRGALVQRLPAVEALAGLDIVCLDKTGTLTDGTLAVEEILPVSGADEREVHALLGMFAASLGSRNPTADALHAQLAGVAAGRLARSAVLLALEVERHRASATATSWCWERPR